jgi:cell division protein FtsB
VYAARHNTSGFRHLMSQVSKRIWIVLVIVILLAILNYFGYLTGPPP